MSSRREDADTHANIRRAQSKAQNIAGVLRSIRGTTALSIGLDRAHDSHTLIASSRAQSPRPFAASPH